MSKGIIETIAGGALIALAVTAVVLTGGALTPLGEFIVSAGAGLVMSGIGTMLQKGPVSGFATTTRNPIAPWEVIYGRARVGGTLVYIAEFGDSNKWLDMVVVLAAHRCQSVDEVLFDGQRLQIGANNTSFTPVQQNLAIPSPSDISRAGDVVTIGGIADIPLLTDGDRILVSGVHPVSLGLNGIFPVYQVLHNYPTSGLCQFSYLCGGSPIPPATITDSGSVRTQWQDYKKNVYIESLGDLGSYNRLAHQQALGETFVGMTDGTPKQGDPTTLVQNDANGNNPWTADCSLVGMTAVHIRLEYDSSIFAGGIPQISFLVRGKNDIQDPRSSPPTAGYTENSALCIADYLSNTTWGFKAAYGDQIDTPGLIAAANICDETVGLAFPLTSPLTTEPRYTCNGHFPVSMKRGDVLQNLLTSCGGRLTYSEGRFVIWPAAWNGVSLTFSEVGSPPIDWLLANATGPIRWKSSVTISGLFNGVKGSYISPVNNWQSSDFPRYAQDADHGYNDGPAMYQYDQNLANDQGDRRWKDIQLPFTISCPMAQRLAKIELMRLRQQGTGTFPLNMAGYQVASLDVLAVNLRPFGWTGKYLEALACRFVFHDPGSGQAPIIGTEVDVQETDPSVYDWALIEELSPQSYQHPGVPNTILTPDQPTNLAISFDDLGNAFLTWTPPTDAFASQIQARYQELQSPEGIWISIGSVDATVTQIALPVLQDATYVVELQAINVAGVSSGWVSITFVPLPFRQKIHPDVAAPNASNPLWDPTDLSFGLSQVYSLGKDNQWSANLYVDTLLPVNSFIPGSIAPVLGSVIGVSHGGGALTPGETYTVGVACYDTADMSQRHYTPCSNLQTLVLPSGCNAIALSEITWPSGDLIGYTIFAVAGAGEAAQVCAQSSVDSSPPALPSAIDILGPLLLSSFNMPTSSIDRARAKACPLVRPGVFSTPATAVDATSITLGILAGTADDWTGRELLLLNKVLDHPFPLASFHVSSYDSSTGKATVTPDPTALISDGASPPSLTPTVEVGDVLALCFAPDTITGLTIGDSKLVNGIFPLGEGSDSTLRAGNTIIAWKKGTDQRQIRKIISNTATVYTVDNAFDPIPDSSWTFMVGWGAWPFAGDYGHVNNAAAGTEVTIPVGVPNVIAANYLVILSALDTRGGETDETIVAMRAIHLNGRGNQSKTLTATSPPTVYQIQSTDQILLCDTTDGDIPIVLPSDAGLLGQSWTIIKNSSDANVVNVDVADPSADTILVLQSSGTAVQLAVQGASTVLVMVQ